MVRKNVPEAEGKNPARVVGNYTYRNLFGMNNRNQLLSKTPLLALTAIWLLSACALLSSCSTEIDASSLNSAPTPVVVRILNLNVAIQVTTEPLPTFTPLPASTQPPQASILDPTDASPSITQGGSRPVTSPTPACDNRAEFIRHLNFSDNAAINANEVFAKVWLVRNVGTCIWTSDYNLVLIAGDAFGSPAAISLSSTVHPGETIDLRANMVAPPIPGAYSNLWVLAAPDGSRFGMGEGGNEPLHLLLTVKAPPRPTPG